MQGVSIMLWGHADVSEHSPSMPSTPCHCEVYRVPGIDDAGDPGRYSAWEPPGAQIERVASRTGDNRPDGVSAAVVVCCVCEIMT